MKNENADEKESDVENLEQDVIYAPDIESGKDITDITDIEKEEKHKSKDDKSTNKKQINFTKKTFIAEENDFNGSIDGKLEDNSEGSEKKIVIEKSPKERFARFAEELGVGAFKRVYRGYDYDTGREIAWNVINVHFMAQDSIIKIKEEINLIKKLNHPNIINFVSGFYNEEKNEIVVITEIFNSGSLKQHLNKIKHPRLKVIKFWCKEILKGLKYLHEFQEPIIHRDIKCDNIFINPNSGQIKIGDLGYSCILRNNDYAKSLSGTPEFMAPEVLDGKYGVLADIYSFGICVLEIITREKPYKECDNNLIEIFEKIKNNILPKSLEKIINPRLLDFIKSCLKQESERPSANDLLNSEFLNDLEHEENNYPALMYPDKINKTVGCSRINSNILTSLTSSNLNSNVSTNTLPSSKYLNINNSAHKSEYDNHHIRNLIKRKASSPAHQRFNNRLSNNQLHENENNHNLSPLGSTHKKFFDDPPKIIPKPLTDVDTQELVPGIDSTYEDKSPVMDKEKTNGDEKSKLNSQLIFDFSGDRQEDLQNIKLLNENDYAKINNNTNFILNKIKNPKISVSSHKLSPFNPASYLLKNGSAKSILPNSATKIEMKIEEENKEDNSILISWVKKDKTKPKGQKISFRFNLNTDTSEGIVNELKNEIGLNEDQKYSIMQKLSNLIKNYTHPTNNNKTQKTSNENKEKDPLLETKKSFDKFFKKFSKILENGEELMQTSNLLKEEINNNKNSLNIEEHNELNEKIKILEDLLKLG